MTAVDLLHRKNLYTLTIAVVAVAVTLAPFMLPSFQLFVVSLALVYTVAILGVNIVMGYAGQVSLGHAGFAAIGAYTVALLMTKLGVSFWIALPVAGLVAAMFGYLLGFPALRLGPVYVAMVTFGFGLVVFLIAQNWYDLTNGPNGIVVPPPDFFGISLHAVNFHIVIAIVTIVLYWLARNLIRSSYGRAFVAIRESQVAAQAMGVNLAQYKTLAFAIGAFYAGLSGGLFVVLSEFVNPDGFQFFVSVLYVTMGLLGGLGYLAGAAIGGSIMAVLPELLRGAVEYKDFLTGFLLLALLIFLPRGVSGLIDEKWPKAERQSAKATTAPAKPDKATRTATAQPPPRPPKESETGEVILDLKNLSKSFGGLHAVQNVNFQIRRGEIFGLIGPNGAGKTTLFNLVSGIYAPTSGEVYFDGREISRIPAHVRTSIGLGRTFQNLELFNEMTVLENVLVGVHTKSRANLFAALARLPSQQREEAELETRALGLLEFVGLKDYADQRADSLPFGHQRLLEIARALAIEPRLIMLDEPAAGLSSSELEFLMDVIRNVRDERGVTVLLIGHTMRLVMGLSDRIVVLDHGEQIAEGTPTTVRADERVVEAYLGTADDA